MSQTSTQTQLERMSQSEERVTASDAFKSASRIPSSMYEVAKQDRLAFWENQARQLDWDQPWDATLAWNRPNAQWFVNGKLNASVNCLDRHLAQNANKTAIIWESEDGRVENYSYQELHTEVKKMASVLRSLGLKKGDRVTIYLPMIPSLAVAVLACARIGAIHSVVFAGFSSDALQGRIQDSESKLLITTDGVHRRGKVLDLQAIAKAATQDCPNLEHVLFIPNLNTDAPAPVSSWKSYPELKSTVGDDSEPESMDSEDSLFILYTSGSTGKPKGIIHSTGGYMTHAAYSFKTVFDHKADDVFWCTADIGWITGHSYVIYGPLANAATVVMYEGSPDFPNYSRFWDMIERHKVSVFYTAPTAIRAFMKWGDEHVTKHDLSSLRLLGTVGEPINPAAWNWFHRVVGGSKCPIVDTWWQTETGGIMISNIPSLNDMKPGSAGIPLPGISAEILNENGEPQSEGSGLLSLTEPWPSMLRGIWGDEQRFKDTYWDRFETYYAGDGANVDADGYFTILGRVDDVLNVSGHRIGTMEVESSIVGVDGVAEAAVVGMPDEIKGQAIIAFVIPKSGANLDAKDIVTHVRGKIGAFAAPKAVILCPDLPKTRSGKIMRRILKAICNGTDIGDVSTLASPEVVEKVREGFSQLQN